MINSYNNKIKKMIKLIKNKQISFYYNKKIFYKKDLLNKIQIKKKKNKN